MGEPCDQRADLFSFGVIMWEIVTHEIPVRGNLRGIQTPQEAPKEASILFTDHSCTPCTHFSWGSRALKDLQSKADAFAVPFFTLPYVHKLACCNPVPLFCSPGHWQQYQAAVMLLATYDVSKASLYRWQTSLKDACDEIRPRGQLPRTSSTS